MFITFEDDKSVVDTPTEEKRKFTPLHVNAHGYDSPYLVKVFIEDEEGRPVCGLHYVDSPYAALFAAAPAFYEIVSAIGDRCTNLYAGQRCPAGFKDQKVWCLSCRAVAALALVDGPQNQGTR